MNKTPSLGIFVIVLLCSGMNVALRVTDVVASGHQRTKLHPLEALPHSSGWVALGVLDAENSKWSAALKFKFELTRSTRGRIVPEPGDVLVITAPLSVIIDGYAIGGDEKYLSPIPERPITEADQTGVVLPPSTRVTVADVVRHAPVGRARAVWARVTPVTPND